MIFYYDVRCKNCKFEVEAFSRTPLKNGSDFSVEFCVSCRDYYLHTVIRELKE